MRAYAALAEEKYKLLTYPVLINILKTGDTEIPTTYESNIAGLRAIQDYRVINLWEVDVNIAFEQPLPSLYYCLLCQFSKVVKMNRQSEKRYEFSGLIITPGRNDCGNK